MPNCGLRGGGISQREEVGCEICGERRALPEFQENGLWLKRCSGCGHFYVSPRPRKGEVVYEIADKLPPPEIHRQNEILRMKMYWKYIDWVKQYGRGKRWLDIGCGSGTFMELIKRKGYEVEGLETNEERLSHCRSRGLKVHSAQDDLLCLAPGSFDIVSMINVFSHLRDLVQFFKALQRVLAPGGIILLATSQLGKRAYRSEVPDWHLGDHVQFAGPHSFQRIASLLGWEAITLNRELTQKVVLKEKLVHQSQRIWVNGVKKCLQGLPFLTKVLGAMICFFRRYASPRREVAILFRKGDYSS